MKKISKNMLLIVLGIVVAFTIDVAAETLISSGAVSYSNAATSETTVSGALDELFSAVDINSKIGTTDISAIGDGTITGALNDLDEKIIYQVYTTSEITLGAGAMMLQKVFSSIAVTGYLPISASVVLSSVPQGTTTVYATTKFYGNELWLQLINNSTSTAIISSYVIRVGYIKV